MFEYYVKNYNVYKSEIFYNMWIKALKMLWVYMSDDFSWKIIYHFISENWNYYLEKNCL